MRVKWAIFKLKHMEVNCFITNRSICNSSKNATTLCKRKKDEIIKWVTEAFEYSNSEIRIFWSSLIYKTQPKHRLLGFFLIWWGSNIMCDKIVWVKRFSRDKVSKWECDIFSLEDTMAPSL